MTSWAKPGRRRRHRATKRVEPEQWPRMLESLIDALDSHPPGP